jgi:hypothetical protein
MRAVRSARENRQPIRFGGIALGIMNSPNDQTPFSTAEFVAASIAMAVVAVVAFQGIWGSGDTNLSALNLSRLRSTSPAGRALQVGPWILDNVDAVKSSRPYRSSDVVAVRKKESFDPGPVAGSRPGQRPADPPASTFFVEAAPATAVQTLIPNIGGPSPPLIGPPDLFRMKHAIVAQSVTPIKEANDASSFRPTDIR